MAAVSGPQLRNPITREGPRQHPGQIFWPPSGGRIRARGFCVLKPREPEFCASGRCLGPDAGRVLRVARGSICGGGHGSQSGSVLQHNSGIEWRRGVHFASPGDSSFFVRHWEPPARLVMFGSFLKLFLSRRGLLELLLPLRQPRRARFGTSWGLLDLSFAVDASWSSLSLFGSLVELI